VLVAALALRVLWLTRVHPNPNDGRFDDTVWYWNTARYIVEGHGYISPYSGATTLLWPPGYPGFLAGVFKLFGSGENQAYAANVALALATIVLMYVFVRLLFGAGVALGASLVLAVWPAQIQFTSLVLSEILFTALFAAALLLTVWMPRARRGRWIWVIALAGAIAAAALTRGQGLLFVPLAILWWALCRGAWRDWWRWSLVLIVATAIFMTPWAVRNEIVSGSFTPVAANFGPDLWLGNHPGASGNMSTKYLPPPDLSPGLRPAEREVAASNRSRDAALKYMRTHPVAEVKLAGKKLRWLYASDATGLDWNSGYGTSEQFSPTMDEWLRRGTNAYWFFVLMLAGAGVVAGLRRHRRETLFLGAIVLAWTAAHLVFFGEPRFHFSLSVVFAPLAALAVARAEEAMRGPPARDAAVADERELEQATP